MAKVDDNKFPKVILQEVATDGSDTPNPAADHRTLFLGEDGLLHLRDSAGTITGVGGSVADILDLETAETDDTLVLAPDGAGGVEFRAEAGGVGGLAQSFVGYDTVGGSFENLTNLRQLMKKITIAAATQFLSIDVHIKATNTDPTHLMVAILEDSAGSPTLVRAVGSSGAQSTSHGLGLKGGNAARWVSIACAAYLPAGDYWLAVVPSTIGTSVLALAYDGSGSDQYFTVGAFQLDGDYGAKTNSTRTYSIRASVLS